MARSHASSAAAGNAADKATLRPMKSAYLITRMEILVLPLDGER